MPGGKLDLPENLLSVEAMGGSDDGEKVQAGPTEDLKDQATSESSIPLSPQWLYSKPNDNKMDVRALGSAISGNSNDPNQKDGWRLEGSEEKKDWRKIAAENESNRRWREEERDTGLLSARRDRRKMDRRSDNVSAREDSRAAPSSDRWHDASNRNSGHEARRDSKWSSRWGPEDKEKESRTEKRTDAEKEKEKEELHNDSQSSTMSSRTISEREGDSRDKWRPRHRMEAHSTGSTPQRAAPGFGLERGRVEGSNLGFNLGRGRAVAIGRSSSASSLSIANSYKGGSIIGKPNVASETFCYPRGKLLDIYRRQKVDPSFATIPVEMEESSSLILVDPVEPMAFFAPEAEEEATIMDIWKGEITSSGVVYNSFKKGRSTEDVPAFQDIESIGGNPGISPFVLADATIDTFEEVANSDECHNGDYWNYGSHTNEFVGEEPGCEREEIVTVRDKISVNVLDSGIFKQEENITASCAGSQLNIGERWKMSNSEYLHSDGAVSAASLDIKSELLDDSGSLFRVFVDDSGKDQNNTIFFASNHELNDDESGTPEDSYFYYIDPNGNTQGPFLGADIILWFEEGYFGLDLPVRSADAHEGTPFQSLGVVIPHLKLREGFAKFALEESGAIEGKVEPSLSPASAPEVAVSSSGNNLFLPFSKMSGFSSQLVDPRLSEPEVSSQLAHTESQSFPDVVAEDEEIVFPGRPGSTRNPSMKTSGNVHDASAKSDTFPSLSNKFSESGLPLQKDNKVHPFGLLWSELEGSHSRHAESSEMPSSLGRSVHFGSSSNDPASAPNWSDFPRQDSLPAGSSFQDAVATHLLSQVEPPRNRFDIAEQLISQQFQQQLQPRNVLPARAHFNEPFLEHLSAQNLIHRQQLANNPTPDLEHLLALQLHQQQQQQQQWQLQLQQQHLHRQQQLLQQQEERQQAQARQVLLEQLLQAQIPDSILSQSLVDPLRTSNVLDQVLLEQQLLQEMQQRSHSPTGHFVPSVEQLAQAKFGQSLQQEQQRDLFELLSRAQHGQALEHQILHREHLQARQLSGLRPQVIGEEERHINAVWPANENDQYRRNLSGNQRAHSSGIGQLDFYQSQQRSALEDQLNQLDQHHTFQDRLRHGLYELGSVPFERSLSLPAGASGINFGVHAQGVQDLSSRMQSSAQVGTFPSSIHHNPGNSLALNQFHVSHLDMIEGCWPEGNGLQANDRMESRLQQLHLNSDQHKRDIGAKVNAEADMGLWLSEGLNDDKAKQLLMDLLHQKPGHRPTYSMDVKDGVLFDKRGPSGFYSIPSSSDHPSSIFPEQEFRPNPAFVVGSYNSSVGETSSLGSAEEQAVNLEINEKLPSTSESGVLFGGPSILSGNSVTGQVAMEDFNIGDKLAINQEYLEVEGRRPRSGNLGFRMNSVIETPEVSAGQVNLSADHGEMSVKPLARNYSLGVGGFYDDKHGPHNYLSEEMPINQVLAPSKGQENILLRRPPVSRLSLSQEGLSELVSDVAFRGKSSLTSTEGGVQANQGADSTDTSKKDMRFRQVSSFSDADGSEPSFMDMLKSGVKKTTAPEGHPQAGATDSMDGMQGGRSGKKKGKKGKQLDPSMLGFKVTSNRIMMGEIQRLED